MLRKPRVVPETSAIPSEERGGSPLSNLNDVLNGLSSASLWQERVYKDLHAHPELSFHETRTAALVVTKLKELGYEVHEQIGRTGVVGVLRNGTGQHVLAYPAGTVGTQVGPVLSAGDSIRITLHGKGAHGSMPHNSVDPVVLAALVVLRLQTIVSRETKPGELAVLTVGSSVAGAKS